MTQPQPPFEIEPVTAGVPEGTALIALKGELDIVAVEGFRRAVGAAAAGRRLVLDLSEVSFMDSAILKELLLARRALTRTGGELVLVAPQAGVQRLLDVTQTSALVRLAPDRETALG